MHRTISNSTYLFNTQSGFYNIHSTSIQTTDPPASAGNRTGKVKKKKKIEEKKAGAEIFASAASLPVSTQALQSAYEYMVDFFFPPFLLTGK